jgi:hypothetical protein
VAPVGADKQVQDGCDLNNYYQSMAKRCNVAFSAARQYNFDGAIFELPAGLYLFSFITILNMSTKVSNHQEASSWMY